MKKAAYLSLLAPIIAQHRKRDYAFWLAHLSGDPILSNPVTKDGTKCIVEICAFWDDQSNGDIRVMFAIDDGGLRAFLPVCDCFRIGCCACFSGRSALSRTNRARTERFDLSVLQNDFNETVEQLL